LPAPNTMLPTVPFKAVADPTAKGLPRWVMLIPPPLSLPLLCVVKAEMLQDVFWHGLLLSELVIVPVARKLRPAVILISPEFWPSVLI
jgi:hypothetical protein